MFKEEDFNTFKIEGLDERMYAIKERIQPKFKKIGDELCNHIESLIGNEMYLHIAKHARRTVNPPNDTWLAVAHNKRGYKKHPHFQLGLFDDHIFIWFALIYELPNKKEVAQHFLEHIDEIYKTIPNDYVISLNHMKKDALLKSKMNKNDIEEVLRKFRDVKKVEFLVGKHIAKEDPILNDQKEFLSTVENIFTTLTPLYKLSTR